jgi:hypothetical protein
MPGHYMSDCPNWMKPQPLAAFIGSGLGFYHIELPQIETTKWLNIQNCGIVVIKKGSSPYQSWNVSYLKFSIKIGHGKLENSLHVSF